MKVQKLLSSPPLQNNRQFNQQLQRRPSLLLVSKSNLSEFTSENFRFCETIAGPINNSESVGLHKFRKTIAGSSNNFESICLHCW
jgi:hypothetical protein